MTAALVAATVGLLSPGLARAHFILMKPTNWMTQDMSATGGGAPQKIGPCGNDTGTGQSPTGAISPVQAGQQVQIMVQVTTQHTGWWRVALKEGASSTQTQTSLPDPQATTCTPPIMTNPVWSPTQPVLADGLGLAAGSTTGVLQTGTQTYMVTIPQNASCTMASPCALQVIMVMNDHQVPANNCYYHHCADVAVPAGSVDGGVTGSGGATGAGGSTTTGTGGTTGQGGSGADAATAGATTGGGCGCDLATARSSSSLAIATIFVGALLLSRRRRRRA